MALNDRFARCYRFGPFQLEARSGELRKHGVRVRLQEQPLQILIMLLDHPGEVVLREEIERHLWHGGTTVEFDHGINAAIRRLRTALGDTAETPRYVETVSRRGYRFLAPVEADPPAAIERAGDALASVDVGAEAPAALEVSREARVVVSPAPVAGLRFGGRRLLVSAASAVVLLAVAALVVARAVRRPAFSDLLPPKGTTLVGGAVLSPDGSKLAAPVANASGATNLWIHSLASGADTILSVEGGVARPFWAPDGKSLAFFSDNQLKRIALPSGAPFRILAALAAGGGAWNRDDTLLFSPDRRGPLYRAGAYGGVGLDPVTRLAEGEVLGHASPHFLPDGRRFLYLAPNLDPGKSAVYLGSLNSLDRKLVLTGASEIDFAGPNRLLFIRGGALMAQSFEPRSGTTRW